MPSCKQTDSLIDGIKTAFINKKPNILIDIQFQSIKDIENSVNKIVSGYFLPQNKSDLQYLLSNKLKFCCTAIDNSFRIDEFLNFECLGNSDGTSFIVYFTAKLNVFLIDLQTLNRNKSKSNKRSRCEIILKNIQKAKEDE
jgi:hypothetical protein